LDYAYSWPEMSI